MRKAVLVLWLLAWAATTSPAQDGEWFNKAFGPSDKRAYDFGTVPRGAVLNHKFQVTNIWAVPVEIMSVRAACGCVTAVPNKQVLQAREAGYIDVTMDARRFAGPKSVTIQILVGPDWTSTATLTVSANSRVDVVFNPGEVNFGVVQAGQSQTQSIEVLYAGTLDWRITDVLINGAPLDVKAEEQYRNRPTQPGQPGQVGYRVKVGLKPEAAPGTQKWEVLLKTNDPATPHVPMLVNATVQASLTVLPGTVTLGSLKAGESMTKPLLVKGAKPFRIMSIEGLGEGIQSDLPATAATLHKLTLQCQPAQPGEFRRQLRIKTDLDGESAVTVTVVGEVVP